MKYKDTNQTNKQTVLTDFYKMLHDYVKTGKKPNANDLPRMYECDFHEETIDYLLDLAKEWKIKISKKYMHDKNYVLQKLGVFT